MSAEQKADTTAGMWVAVHLRSGTPVSSTVYAQEDRVTLHVEGTNCARLTLFVNRADLDRLVDAVTAARDQLATNTATATITASTTDPTDTAAADAA